MKYDNDPTSSFFFRAVKIFFWPSERTQLNHTWWNRFTLFFWLLIFYTIPLGVRKEINLTTTDN